MKKAVLFICTIVLAISLTVTTFAAPPSPFLITSSSGNVQREQAQVPAGVDNSVNAVQTAKKLGTKNTEELSLLSVFEFSGIPGAQNLTIKGATNRRVLLLHYHKDAWEVAYDGYADDTGTIYFDLSDFSPFAVLLGNTAPISGTSAEETEKTADEVPSETASKAVTETASETAGEVVSEKTNETVNETLGEPADKVPDVTTSETTDEVGSELEEKDSGNPVLIGIAVVCCIILALFILKKAKAKKNNKVSAGNDR